MIIGLIIKEITNDGLNGVKRWAYGMKSIYFRWLKLASSKLRRHESVFLSH